MKQGWTVTLVLWDKSTTSPLYDENDLRSCIKDMLRALPIDFTYQHIYIKKHKTRLKK